MSVFVWAGQSSRRFGLVSPWKISIAFLKKWYKTEFLDKFRETASMKESMTDDSVVDKNTPNVLEEPENSVLRGPSHGETDDPPSRAECCEDNADAENDSFQSTLHHLSFTDALWRRLSRWHKTVFYIRHKMAVSCCNGRKSGLLFCMQGTGYYDSLNSMLEMIVVRNYAVCPKAPERLQSYFQEK